MKRSVLIAGAAFLALGGLAAASSRTSATAKQAAAPRVHTIRYAVHIGRPAGAGFQPRDLGQDNAELGRETAALTKVLLSWQATLGTPTSWQQIAAQVQNHLISDWERALAQ